MFQDSQRYKPNAFALPSLDTTCCGWLSILDTQFDLFKSATSQAGKNIDFPLLGNLTKGAPADVIAVKGNPFEKYKLLEYPDLVISGGKTIVNHFRK